MGRPLGTYSRPLRLFTVILESRSIERAPQRIMTSTKSSTSSVAPLGVRKVERPRPLGSLSHVGHQTDADLANAATNRRMSAQDVSTVEEIIHLLEQVESNLKALNYDKVVVASVVKLNV